ncbi:TNase-like domain-containing protein [Azospirillaceae bacterium]
MWRRFDKFDKKENSAIRSKVKAAVFFSCLFLTPIWPQAAENKPSSTLSSTPKVISGNATAKSGDVLIITNLPIRILGISAPVSGQKCQTRYGHLYDCFKIAKDVLQSLINTRVVHCTIKQSSKSSQKIGYCNVAGIDLGAAMVSRGWAFAYRGLTPDYSEAEAYAQSLKIGMWAGLVEKPWQYQSRTMRESTK